MDFTPAILGAELVAAGEVVLPWVGAAVTAGAGLMFVFYGIRAGFRFFRDVYNGRHGGEWAYDGGEPEDRWDRMADYYSDGYEAVIRAGGTDREAHEAADWAVGQADARGEFD